MNTLDKIQPLVDEYCVCKIKQLMLVAKHKLYPIPSLDNQLYELQLIMTENEQAIMQILFDENKQRINKIIKP